MRKSFKTEEFIDNNVARGNSILTPAELSKQKSIAKKRGFELTYSRQTNMNLYWEAIKLEMNELKQSHPVRYHYEQDLRVWHYRNEDSEIIIAYMKHEKVYESEFMLLASPKLDKLYDFMYDLMMEGIDSSEDGGAMVFINNGANYYDYLSKYSKKYADPEALKSTTNLMNTLESLTAGLSNTEKANLSTVVLQYLTAFDRPLDFDTLHNLLYKGQ